MKEWLDARLDGHIKLIKTIAAIPAPSHHEERRAAFLLEWLKAHGFEGSYADGAKNVVIPLFDGDARGITVFAAHTDVVFPDETELPVREEGGRLYAPGVGDDTANVAAILTVLLYLKEHGIKPGSPVMFVLNSCEEGLGNLKGTRRIVEDFGGRIESFVSFDCSIEEGMAVRAVGSERWRVSCETEGGHSFMAFGKPNAIRHMAGLVNELYGQTVPEAEGTRTTYNVGMINGGTSINTIAQSCELYYEYRSDDRGCLAAMRESFKRLLAEADSEDARFSSELIGERPCGGEVDKERLSALFGLCERTVFEVTGRTIPRFSASTDANIPLSLGIPAVTIGLFSGEGAHTRGEWIELSSVRPGLEIALRLVLGITGTCNVPGDRL